MRFKISILIIALYGLTAQHAQSQFKISSIIKQVAPQKNELSDTEIVSGLKEALETGVSAGTGRLSATDGFFKNLAVKIFFPPEAQKMEKKLRRLGFNDQCDQVILSLNRAAEDASKEALPIFVTAIKNMSINNAKNILLGKEKNAATNYFKQTTTDQLKEKFKPIIQNSLEKVGATKHWSAAMTQYNKIPMVTKINPDLTDYALQKALDGLFYEIAQEELNIRNNINARGTELLQRVFSYADKNK